MIINWNLSASMKVTCERKWQRPLDQIALLAPISMGWWVWSQIQILSGARINYQAKKINKNRKKAVCKRKQWSKRGWEEGIEISCSSNNLQLLFLEILKATSQICSLFNVRTYRTKGKNSLPRMDKFTQIKNRRQWTLPYIFFFLEKHLQHPTLFL
jgi:hypothetical protein